MSSTDPIAVCAAGSAAFEAVAHRGLRAPWTVGPDIAYGTAPHRFLLAAVTLTPRPALPPGLTATVRDSWAALTDEDLRAWCSEPADPWLLRAGGPCSAPPVDDVEVVRTDDPLLFERAAFLAVTGRPPDLPGELHPAGSADQPGLALFLALSGGEPVGTALSVTHPDGIVVSAVGVRADHRRRGIGTLLTAAAVDVAPDRPATLTASALGERIYLELGFERVGQGLDWRPPG